MQRFAASPESDIDPADDCPWVKTSVSNGSGDAWNYRFFTYDE